MNFLWCAGHIVPVKGRIFPFIFNCCQWQEHFGHSHVYQFTSYHMKYSIIIPTYQNLEKCLRPCLESIKKNTSLEDLEVVVVSNGCTDGTDEYVRSLGAPFKLLSFPDPLGYTKAVNTGLGVATGEYVILMNNDCQILDYAPKNDWIEKLVDPFDDQRVGITGIKRLPFHSENFLVFFLVMIPRRLFFEIGYLDETYNPGGGEDIDFCLRLKKAGYISKVVPDDLDDSRYETTYPLYHEGEATVHSLVDGWEDKFATRMQLTKDRLDRGYYSNFADVTCEISTKGRYFTTLPLAITSVALQKLKPKKILIFQDDLHEDLRKYSIYANIFALLERQGIEWEVVFGTNSGQVANHQKAIELAKTEWIWRLDDDNYAEPDVLERLMEETTDKVGAVAPSVIDPLMPLDNMSLGWSTDIKNIDTHMNVQWLRPVAGEADVVSADHLYSTFIYRKAAAVHGYNKNLSPVGHREETIFTYEMSRLGWMLLVNRGPVVWHLRENTGGIRTYDNHELWASDERVFRDKCKNWGVNILSRLWINLDCGRGDHYVFKMALADIKKANPDKLITCAAAFPEYLMDEKGIEIVSVADGKRFLGARFEDLNIYSFGERNNWNGSLKDAFKKLYGA